MPARTKVIIIGCGIAGPVLATFLKLKDYHPVVYERVPKLGGGGISHLLHPNGLRVLSQIPGLSERLSNTMTVDQFKMVSTLLGDEGHLVTNNAMTSFAKEFGEPLKAVIRADFHRILLESAQDHGVEINWGHTLTHLEQTDQDVRVFFENGATDTGSFVIGCDGLHSRTRLEVLGQDHPTGPNYSGLAATAGLTPTPSELQDSYAMVQWFGDGIHFLTYRSSSTLSSWSCIRWEPESKDAWRTLDPKAARAELLPIWNSGIPKELLQNAETTVKFGLYDRPALDQWHKRRVVILGDAAHPTTPHIGQGANQAFEDIHELVRCLLKYNPDTKSPSTQTLELLFKEYENNRIPRSAKMVKGARQGGEDRVTQGLEECLQRNERIKHVWGDEVLTLSQYHDLFGPRPADLISGDNHSNDLKN